MKKASIFLSFWALLALSGCTTGPAFRHPLADVPGGASGQAPNLVPATLSPVAVGDTNWAAPIQDDELQMLVRAALEHGNDVRACAERLIAAQAQYGALLGGEQPSTKAVIEKARQQETYRTLPAHVEPGQLDVAASWELDFWNNYQKANEQERISLTTSSLGQKAIRNTMLYNVVVSYLQLRTLGVELEIAQNTLISRQVSLHRIQILADNNAVPTADVWQAEQFVQSESTAIQNLRERITQHESYISTLIGSGLIAYSRTNPEQPRLLSVPLGLPSQLIERRPDIRQAEEKLIASNARITTAKAALLPSIPLTGLRGSPSSELAKLSTEPVGFKNVSPSLFQSVFQHSAVRNNGRSAEQHQALFAYQKTVLDAFREMYDSLVVYQKTSEVRQERERLVTAAQNSYKLVRIRYDGGTVAYLDVLTSERDLYSAELNLSQSRLNEAIAAVRIYNSLGGEWRQ